MGCHLLGDLQLAPVLEVRRDAGGAEKSQKTITPLPP
jgi:hypothetical protein